MEPQCEIMCSGVRNPHQPCLWSLVTDSVHHISGHLLRVWLAMTYIKMKSSCSQETHTLKSQPVGQYWEQWDVAGCEVLGKSFTQPYCGAATRESVSAADLRSASSSRLVVPELSFQGWIHALWPTTTRP